MQPQLPGNDLAPRAHCSGCSHAAELLDAGRCRPGESCVVAMSGRQMDRFFRNNLQLAPD